MDRERYVFHAGSKAVVALVPLGPLTDSKGAAVTVECQAHEVWMVRLAADGAAVDRQSVGAGCAGDTPYGGACEGMPVIKVTPPARPDARHRGKFQAAGETFSGP